jgi:hypothetical protein
MPEPESSLAPLLDAMARFSSRPGCDLGGPQVHAARVGLEVWLSTGCPRPVSAA